MSDEKNEKAPRFVQVDRERYLDFVHSWPGRLEFDCTGICEPPLGTYNDFSGGKLWPESVVAKESRGWLGPNGEVDNSMPGKFWEYFVLEAPEGSEPPTAQEFARLKHEAATLRHALEGMLEMHTKVSKKVNWAASWLGAEEIRLMNENEIRAKAALEATVQRVRRE